MFLFPDENSEESSQSHSGSSQEEVSDNDEDVIDELSSVYSQEVLVFQSNENRMATNDALLANGSRVNSAVSSDEPDSDSESEGFSESNIETDSSRDSLFDNNFVRNKNVNLRYKNGDKKMEDGNIPRIKRKRRRKGGK